MFLPPESCSFDSMNYSMKKADIWSLGVTIYILTFNKLPFSCGATELDIMDNICNFTLEFNGRVISEELRKMLEMFLEKDPSRRASIEQLKNCKFIQMENQDVPRSDSLMIEKKIAPFSSFGIQLCEIGDSPKLRKESSFVEEIIKFQKGQSSLGKSSNSSSTNKPMLQDDDDFFF